MAKFDTPITTNDQSVDRILTNPLPVLLMLNSGPLSTPIQSMLADLAKAEAGKILVSKLDTIENPQTAKKFGATNGPRLITWKSGAEQVQLDNPTPALIRAAAEHLLGRGPAPKSEPKTQPNGSQAGAADGHPITVTEATFGQQYYKVPNQSW
jgi:thioredoxin 1